MTRKWIRRPINKCAICGKETKNNKYCSRKCTAQDSGLKKFWENGGTPWRTGLTKKTSPSIAAGAKKSSATLKGRTRTTPVWNKGLTKDTDDERFKRWLDSNIQSRKHLFGKTYEEIHGIEKAIDRRFRMGQSISATRIMKEIPAWNRGLTKEIDSRLECSPQARETLLYYAKQPKSEKFKQNLRNQMLDHWQDPSKAEPHLRNIFKMLKDRVIPIPNSQEILLNSILDEFFPGEWKFVGDGKSIVGTKSPDFIGTNGRKEIIELYGDYWHRNDNPQDRIDYFKDYGYSTLVIWVSELKDKNKVAGRIREWQESLMCSVGH